MLGRGRNRTSGSKGATSSATSLVAESTIFKFNTEQCQDDPEKAQEIIEECCFLCGCAWDTEMVSLRFWDSLDGPWIDDWYEATQSFFYVEVSDDG